MTRAVRLSNESEGETSPHQAWSLGKSKLIAVYACVFVFLTITGGQTWRSASDSQVPPFWDAESYVDKATNFWSEVDKGEWFNPLNTYPTVRPPGTVLISAPFGVETKPGAFYFRSIFVPIVLFVAALMIIGLLTQTLGVPHALFTMAFCTLPLFWQFEPADHFEGSLSWGFVDNFLAAVGALSAALLASSVIRRSLVAFIFGLLTCALCPFIKPAGLLLMGMLLGFWFLFAVLVFSRSRTTREWILFGSGTVLASAVTTLVIWMCYSSAYFSLENMAFGKAALEVLRTHAAFTGMDLGAQFKVNGGLSLVVIVGCALFSVFRRQSAFRLDGLSEPFVIMAFAGIGFAVIGLAVCYYGTLLRQLRYFSPFALICAVLILPVVCRALAQRQAAARRVIYGVLFVPCVSLVVFLGTPSFVNAAYRIYGYNLTTSHYSEMLATTSGFLRELAANDRLPQTLFAPTNAQALGLFEAAVITDVDKLTSGQGSLTIVRPFSWWDGGGLQLGALVDADLIATAIANDILDDPIPLRATSFLEEIEAVSLWLAQDPPPPGLKRVLRSSFPNLTVTCVYVEDRQQFGRAVRSFKNSIKWRQEFHTANEGNRVRSEEIPGDVENLVISKREPMDFVGAFRLHRLEVKRDDDSLQFSAHVERLDAPLKGTATLYIHFLDDKGEIIGNHGMALPRHRIEDESISVLRGDLSFPAQTRAIGLGIACPVDGALRSDERAQDWDQRRIRLAIDTLKLYERAH